MNELIIGAYWQDRPQTLRDFASGAKQFIFLLQEIHPAFQSLAWVGDSPRRAVKLEPDLGNLDELIYRRAWDSDLLYTPAHADGSPTWEAIGPTGYQLLLAAPYDSVRNGIEVGIHTGLAGPWMDNAVTIAFPGSGDAHFPHRDFYNYAFIRKLFEQIIRFWAPEHGLVFSQSFADAVDPESMPGAGWLTYLREPRAADAVRDDPALAQLQVEELEAGGALISLGRDLISPDNAGQVALARRLRQRLAEARLIEI
jgi:hypothetical protein